MDIRGLGYIGVNVNDIGAWRSYAELLGTMVVPSEGGFKIRIDDRPFRVAVRQTDAMDGLLFAGWELSLFKGTLDEEWQAIAVEALVER